MAWRVRRSGRGIASFAHADNDSANNPPFGLAIRDRDPDTGARTHRHFPGVDPRPTWAGKADHTLFDVSPVPLLSRDRIDPCTVIEAFRRRNAQEARRFLLAATAANSPIHQVVKSDKYRHSGTGRLTARASRPVVKNLLEKEGLGGPDQLASIAPPYGGRCGPNFQPLVNLREVVDGNGENLTGEPEQIRAYRDNSGIGIHSYLTYRPDRPMQGCELQHECGSCFVQIGDESVRFVGMVINEIPRAGNRMAAVPCANTGTRSTSVLPGVAGCLL